MNRRVEPPTSSRIALTRESSASFEPFPSVRPVIGVSTKSSIAMVGARVAAGDWRAAWPGGAGESEEQTSANARTLVRRIRLFMVMMVMAAPAHEFRALL